MSGSDLDRLLGGPEMAWLVQRVRERLTVPDGEALAGVVVLRDPSEGQRAGAVRLVGPPRRAGRTLRVNLADVETVLRRGPWPRGLADAVVTLTGPVQDRRAARAAVAEAWASAAGRLGAETGRSPELLAWWHAWCAAGGLKRAARSEATRLGVEAGPGVAGALVDQVRSVLDALPVRGVPRAVFARDLLGDAHALDDARPLGRLAVTVLQAAWVRGLLAPSREALEHDDAARARTGTSLSPREVWAAVGVLTSTVASTVLALGVRGAGAARAPANVAPGARAVDLGGATAAALESMRAARSPLVLTLEQVRSGGVAPCDPSEVVRVCENPTVLEVAAARWTAAAQIDEVPADSARSPVLVCTFGQPSTAVLELLEVLTSRGAECRYHGDFDWAGMRIAQTLLRRVPWQPWRYRAEDYRRAAELSDSTLALSGPPAGTPWDPALANAMTETGIAVEEEEVVDALMADLLARAPRGEE